MILHLFGRDALARLLAEERDERARARGSDYGWLLHGPTDERVAEPPADALRWAAE